MSEGSWRLWRKNWRMLCPQTMLLLWMQVRRHVHTCQVVLLACHHSSKKFLVVHKQ